MRIRRHRRTRRQLKKQRKIIIISIICFMFIMVGGYSAFQTNLNITAKGNIKEKSKVIQSWASTSNEDFHTDYYRENIVTATFLDTNQVPNNATESWNVSEDKTHGGVMAWVVLNEEDSTKYDLYIGAKDGVIANEDSSWLFSDFTSMKTIDFKNNFDTSNVINMGNMFRRCNNLINLDVSTLNTTKVQYMTRMFSGCSSLLILKLDNFNTVNVIDMQDMFSYSGIVSLDLSNFDTKNVTNMQGVFFDCSQLENIIGLEQFNTDNVTRMYGMFYNCQKLTTLNLCSFNTNNVTDMNDFFRNTISLTKILVGKNWNIDKATTDCIFCGSGVSEVTYGQC